MSGIDFNFKPIEHQIHIPAKFGDGSVKVSSHPDDLVLNVKLSAIKYAKEKIGVNHKKYQKLVPEKFGLGIQKKGKFQELLSEQQVLSKKSIMPGCELVLVYLKDLEKQTGKGKGRWRMDKEEKKEVDKNRTTRQKIATEVLETEKAYIESLHVIIEHFIHPLSLVAGQKRKQIISNDQINSLFGNISDIFKLNQIFCQKLEDRINEWGTKGGILGMQLNQQMLGDVFMIIAPDLKIYSTYVANHEKATALLETLQSNEKFQDFCKEKEALPASKGQRLTSNLIKPIQRIPRYKLLLQEILKNTATTHKDYANLHKAVQLINDAALHINEECRAQEERAKIRQLEEKFEPKQDFISNNPRRRLMKRGKLIISGISGSTKKGISANLQYEFILFDDMIVIASSKGRISSKLSVLDTLMLNKKISIQNPKTESISTTTTTTTSTSSITRKISIKRKASKSRARIILSYGDDEQARKYTINATEEKILHEWGVEISACLKRSVDKGNIQKEKKVVTPKMSSRQDVIGEELFCEICEVKFTFINRRHHCRMCHRAVCDQCSKTRQELDLGKEKKRVCDKCKHKIMFVVDEPHFKSGFCGSTPIFTVKVSVLPKYSGSVMPKIVSPKSGTLKKSLSGSKQSYISKKKTQSEFRKLEKVVKTKLPEVAKNPDFMLPPNIRDSAGYSAFLLNVASCPELEQDISKFLGVPVEHWKGSDTDSIQKTTLLSKSRKTTKVVNGSTRPEKLQDNLKKSTKKINKKNPQQ